MWGVCGLFFIIRDMCVYICIWNVFYICIWGSVCEYEWNIVYNIVYRVMRGKRF